jgi:subtilase family serine protease
MNMNSVNHTIFLLIFLLFDAATNTSIITATYNFNSLLKNVKPKIPSLNLTDSTLNYTFTTPELLTNFVITNNNNNTQVVTSLSDSTLLAIILPIVIIFLIACLIILSILIVFFKKRFRFISY